MSEDLLAFGREHGVAALLDHLGLDELGNQVTAQITTLKRIEKVARSNPRDLNPEWVRGRCEEALGTVR